MSWFYFPSVGVRKLLYLIIREKKHIIFSKIIANNVINVIIASQWLFFEAVIPDFSSAQTDQGLAHLTCN